MEALSLLRYWRTNVIDATTEPDVRTSTATTIVTAVSTLTSETEDDDNDNDHGPFFDLEFSLPTQGDENEEHELLKPGETEITQNNIDYEDEEDSDGSDESEDERDVNFTLLSGSSGESTTDVNVSVSPSDDLFFNGGFVPVDNTVEIRSKPLQSRVSLMNSATKFRVMMLKLRKLKSNADSSEATDLNASSCSNSKEEQKKEDEKDKLDKNNVESEDSGKSTTVKYNNKVDVPIVSLFKRHNSSKATKKRQNDTVSVSSSSDEKKFTKEAMQRYLRKVKPLYIRVSKRYGQKLKFTGVTKPNQAPSPSPSPAANSKENESNSEVSDLPLLRNNIKALKQGNLPAGLRVVCKQLRKSGSAFTAVAAAPPGPMPSKRRDDSLLQQQDGIQSAILHCKRSFKASRDSDCSSSSLSDPVQSDSKCENGSDAVEEEEEMKKR